MIAEQNEQIFYIILDHTGNLMKEYAREYHKFFGPHTTMEEWANLHTERRLIHKYVLSNQTHVSKSQ